MNARTFTEDDTARLAAALRSAVQVPIPASVISAADSWRDLARLALDGAGLALTDEQFDRAWRALWRSAFMGGNYRLDAERMLRAADGEVIV